MFKENDTTLPKYYNNDFDYSQLSKTDLRKILFDHNITPPPYNTLKAELLEFYENNFHKKLNFFRKKYIDTLKTIRRSETGNLTALDLSFDEDKNFPVRDVHEEIHNSLNNLTPKKVLIKNKERLISETNNLGSEDIEELEDLLEGIHQNSKQVKIVNGRNFNEELITTPEALKSFSGFNSSFNYEDSFNKKEVDPSVGTRTPEFCSSSPSTFNLRTKTGKLTSKNSVLFFIWNFLSKILKLFFILYFLNEIIKNLWCPFCLEKEAIFSKAFFKKLVSKDILKKEKLKNIFKEFSYCQEKPEYIFLDEEKQEFKFKPGFLRNENYFTKPLRRFSIEDKMTYDITKSLRTIFYSKQTREFSFLKLSETYKLTSQMDSKEVFDDLNSSFMDFYELNSKEYEDLFEVEKLKKDYLKLMGKKYSLDILNFIKSVYLKIALDLIFDNPNIDYSEEKNIFTVNFTWGNLFEFYFLKFFLIWIVLKSVVWLLQKSKGNISETKFIKNIVNEILTQEGTEFLEEGELRECYSELSDTVWKKVTKTLKEADLEKQ